MDTNQSLGVSRGRKLRPGQLAYCGNTFVEIIEVSRGWAKVKPFHKSDGVESFDRPIEQIRTVR